ncbi:receptor protein tyrosine phosphatase n [Schistosoma japonicum]|nr:receptor protein tyrosine phosphatase n [Schistosoma japonicum]
MIIVKHDVGLSSINVVLNGGYIGCLYQEVCLREEVCYDDSLFGRCVLRDLHGDQWSISPTHKSRIKSLVLNKQPQEYNWADTTLQCMLRTILLESESHSTTVDPKSFCLYQHHTDDDSQLYSKYIKREVREHRGYPNFMFSNPLKTRNPYYFPETLHESTNSDNKYDLWDDTLINKGINNERNKGDHFTKQIDQMKLLPAIYEEYNNVKFNGEQELADKLMDESVKEDNSNMATKLSQNDYLLSGSK